MIIGFTKEFYLLKLESHTADHVLRDAFRTLTKADFHIEEEGAFHSAFLQLATGIERLLKITIVSHELLERRYKSLKPGYLRSAFSHDLSKAYAECISLLKRRQAPVNALSELQRKILSFLTAFAKGERYFHLDQLESPSQAKDPVSVWLSIVRNLHKERHSANRVTMYFQKLLQRLDKANVHNCFTKILDSTGYPLQVADIEHDRLMWKMNKRHVVFAIIQCLRPIRELLNMLSAEATIIEAEMKMGEMVIPEYSDFFLFLNVDKESDIRNALWTK